MRSSLVVVVLGMLVGCGDDDGGSSPIDAAVDAALALTIPTITEGGTIPLTHVCTDRGGMNLSPALAWTNPPAGTQSYAYVLTDKNNDLVHAAVYDIPATLAGLPADLENAYAPSDAAGVHQAASYQPSIRGWNGPCPGQMHTYEIKLYALATPTLPNAMMGTTRSQIVTALATNLGTATLTATFTP